MSANDRQVGGDHYRAQAGFEQHWDRQWRLFGPGYFVGNITAYVERYRLKNGLEDLRKAEHYLQKLIELEAAAADGSGPPPGGGLEALANVVECGVAPQDDGPSGNIRRAAQPGGDV